MSWDVSIVIDTGSPSGPVEVEDIGNVTYNVSPMYYRVLPKGVRTIDGMFCPAAAELLAPAIAEMERRYDELKLLNPANGWGNIDGAIEFLKRILKGCRNHPKAFVKIY